MAEKAIQPGEEAFSKVAKLLPSEVTGLYLSLRPLVAGGDHPWVHLTVAITCLVFAIAFIRIARGVGNWLHTTFYAITFGVWVLTLEPDGAAYFLTDRWHVTTFDAKEYATIVAILSIFWTFAVTYIIPARLVATVPAAPPGR